MPGFYPEDEYDLAGFSVGVVDKSKILDNTQIKPGDAVISLASSGVHSNGFSLIRKTFQIDKTGKDGLGMYSAELGQTLGETLLIPTKIYVKPMLALFDAVTVKAVSHITGGGFYENIPRCLPEGKKAVIQKDKLEIPPIFRLMQKVGNIPERDMFNTFNMGTGMCAVVSSGDADKAVSILNSCGQKASVIGEIQAGETGVEIL